MTVAAPLAFGPQCPHCKKALPEEWIQTGAIVCPACTRTFNATAFHPPQQKPRAVAVVESFPEGANACANHPGNAAVTSCSRCGLFVCSLCDMNLGDGSQCPSCFDRMRAEGGLRGAAIRSMDYGAMAILSAVAGVLLLIMMLSIPFGALTSYCARKGAAQRRDDGEKTLWMSVLFSIGILEMLAGFTWLGFIVWAIVTESK